MHQQLAANRQVTNLPHGRSAAIKAASTAAFDSKETADMRMALASAILIVFSCAHAAESAFERFTLSSIDQYRIAAYPTIARLADERLLCTFSAIDKKTGDKAIIVGTFSENHGRSWGKPLVLIDSPGELDYDPNIIVIGSRLIVTSTTVPTTHAQYVSTSRTVAVRSEDNGKTWSKPYVTPMGHRYTSGKINTGIVLKDGTILFGYSWDAKLEKGGRIKGDSEQVVHAGLMISEDHGQSWSPSEDVVLRYRKSEDNKRAISGIDEPAIVECRDGSVYMLCRTGLDRLYECRSKDGGRTWSPPVASALTSFNAPASLCGFAGEKHGILAVWCNSPRERWPLCVAASYDDGTSWTPPRQLAMVEGFQSSYPGCTKAADGSLVVVWQQARPDRRREILGARFNPEWLQEPK